MALAKILLNVQLNHKPIEDISTAIDIKEYTGWSLINLDLRKAFDTNDLAYE